MKAKVKIETIHTGELPVVIHTIGAVVPRRQHASSVISWIGGVVSSVEVRDGETVDSGTVLLRLDARAVANALAKARAGLRSAEAALDKAVNGGLDSTQADLDLAASQADTAARQAKLESDRQDALLAEKLTSEKAALVARQAKQETERAAKATSDKARYYRTSGRATELAQLQAAVEQAKAEVRVADQDMENAVIHAPGQGRIIRLDANVGRMLAPGTVVAHVIGDTASAVLIHLAPRDADAIRLGAPVSIRTVMRDTLAAPAAPTHVELEPDTGPAHLTTTGTLPVEKATPNAQSEPDTGTANSTEENVLSGRVVSIGVELDPELGLVPVEVYLQAKSSPPRIGETVYADIAVRAPAHGLVVPVSALTFEEDAASIFTVDEKQIAHEVRVEVLARTADKAVIAGKGLTDGVRIVVDGNYNLPDGAHVVEEPAK